VIATPGCPRNPPARESCARARSARAPALALALFLGVFAPARAATDHGDCLDCHGDSDFETERAGRTVSLYVDEVRFTASVHGKLDCADCHADVDVDDLPHAEDLEPVLCGICHDAEQTAFDTGVHGQALKRRAPYAPDCRDCHGVHDILSPSDPRSPSYKMNVPYLCGGCHREGAPVARTYDIGEHNIVDNYSQSIHGVGLFEKGLTVTATCTDCHNSHMILPHTDPRASIAPRNIARTCMQCHARIEDVHEKIIRGELWEKSPGVIPACTDCHLPHRVRKETVEITLSNRDCLKCHEDPDLDKVTEGGETVSMFVNASVLQNSMHQNIPCVKCHTDVDPRARRPCETSVRADCSNCHAKIAQEFDASSHGRAFHAGHPDAPNCITCHGDHGVQSHRIDGSPTFRAAVPALCGDCHKDGGVASAEPALSGGAVLEDYSTSVHGRGLREKGLLPSAICIDCHGSHLVLDRTDPQSTVHENNVAATCATCHQGIYKQYIKSVHFSADPEGGVKLPNCAECHHSHKIQPVEQDRFLHEVTEQCGACHSELASTYLDTMHGKAYKLGYMKAAKCSDCHGEHAILAVDDPHSTVGVRNIVETCRKCHEDATQRFTGYLTHATHHDPVKYPILYYTYWSMTCLLVGVFGFFGLHTLLWLPRSFRQSGARRKREPAGESRHYIRRFSDSQRITHLLVIVSFLSLALTGMMLRFSSMPWAEFLAGVFGGVRVAGIIHRTAAVITFGYFVFHLSSLVRLKRRRRLSWRELALGKNSMMFNRKDLRDFAATLKWFFGKGPRPDYGRWTYWEKFDYLAVFWGVAIIGASGLMLWFPEFFTRFLPGWLINVATIVHSDEALLAVGFIFTIHFFNTHLRPEVFPMDTVVFTGVMPLREYKEDRPQEYAELKESGELRKRVVTKTISPRTMLIVRLAGSVFLLIGLCLIGLILYSVLSGYR
jgi:cytochrome b subunit of formate dehydrogenase